MKYKGPNFRLSAITLGLLSSSFNVFSQDANQQDLNAIEVKTLKAKENEALVDEEDADEVEVITVEGFRGSLIKSMNDKRFAGNVTDSIFAEDIGKATDQNIADALSRITGVSVQSVDGEGSKITVRGADPSQNMITLNGVQLTSADFNQSVDLSTFSADVLSKITVIKTPSADHDEGSLGASINLSSARPLELSNNKRSLTFQGRYNDFSEENDYKLSGSFSQKFLDEKVGFIITAFNETSSIRRDEIKITDFDARTVTAAHDQNGNVITNYTALGPEAVNYELYQNSRDRFGANGSLQFLPSENTNVLLDFNYSKFTGSDVSHGVTIRDSFPDRLDFQEGVTSGVQLDGQVFVPTFSDPTQDWTVVNTDTRTVEKRLRRFGDGGFNQRNTTSNTVNSQFGIQIDHELTDTIRFEVGANYSKTTLEPEPSFTVNLLSGNNPPQGRLLAGPVTDPHTGIQPAGYDCTNGGVCVPVFGDGLITENDPFNPFDNTSRTAWNPDDINAHSVNNFFILDSEVEDSQRTAFVDFDWDVDFAGITQIEFGAKYRKRKKIVDNQRYQVNNTAAVVTVDRFDADGNLVGQQILREGIGLNQIPAKDYAFEGQFPYDNFLSDLGVPQNSLTDGWALVSALKLQELAFANANLELEPDPGEYRETELEDKAAYLKFNFVLADGRLHGDVGVRYIETDSTSLGNSSVQFAGDNVLGRAFDPFLWAQLRDFSNPECEIIGRPRTVNQWAGYNRIDGLGWDFTQDTPVRLPADPSGYPCYDPLTLPGAAQTFINGRHEDISRHPFYVWGDDPTVVEDRSQASFQTSGSNNYSMFLPSLNVNYQIRDDLIGRFAVSKTISRAQIDSLRPGFTLNENFWSPGDQASGSLRLTNPELMPQESKNLDLSVEWYFNPTGLLSAAFFYKDMSNFEESETALVYAQDLRYVDLTQPYDVNGLILSETEVREALTNPELTDGVGIAACFPDRGNNSDINGAADWFFNETDLINWCSQFDAQRLINGAGATIKGVELGYQQTYDFLPGLWSGLGVTMNYTYQESETDPEVSSFDETKILPQFPRPFTPKHSYNATVYWEKFGHQIRLALRGKSDELFDRFFEQGSLWQEGSNNLDLSASYKISNNMSVSFHALNLTDETTRIYYTSRSVLLDGEVYDEGNPLEDSSVTTGRTQTLSKTGRTYRLDFRVVF